MPDAPPALEFQSVEKHYGGLRPLRVRALAIPYRSRASLIGFDQPAAEVFVNLATGAALPDAGEVRALGMATASIAEGDAWLRFVERFGFVSARVVLLESMTIEQNLALPFGLELEPVPADVVPRVRGLADEAAIPREALGVAAARADPLLRARVTLARALALGPEMLLVEHPTAGLSSGDSRRYAALLREIVERRALTAAALTVDERFAEAFGGRLLTWQPATGELRERRRRWF